MQPLFELLECQPAGIGIGNAPPDLLDLFVGQPIDALVLRFISINSFAASSWRSLG